MSLVPFKPSIQYMVRGPCLIEGRISGNFQRSEVQTAVVRSQVRGRGRYSRSCLPSTYTRTCASRWRGQMWPWGGVGGQNGPSCRADGQIVYRQVRVAQQRAEIAQQPTKRCEAVLGKLGGYAQLLVVDRGLLQLRLGCQLLSAGRRTPSCMQRPPPTAATMWTSKVEKAPLELRRPWTRALFRGP